MREHTMPRFDRAFDWVRRHVEHGPLPTAVLGVATAEGVVALEAFGSEGGRAASVDDHYPLFSITKPIIGLTALRLIEQGRVTFETPLTNAVPEFGAERDDVVRLRHLVSHTSGIAEPPVETPLGLRPLLLSPGRDFAAGTVSRYSTIAFEGLRHSAQGLLAHDTFGHGGWAGTEFWITPSLGVCFVLLTNIGAGFRRLGVDGDELHNAVAAAA